MCGGGGECSGYAQTKVLDVNRYSIFYWPFLLALPSNNLSFVGPSGVRVREQRSGPGH